MIEYSQAILLITTTLVVVSTIAYLGAFFAVRMSRAPVATAATESAGTVVINAGDGDRTVAVTGGIRHAPVKRFTVTWWAAKSTQLSLVLLTGSLIIRMIATGHAPFSNHYEFAISFAWGMILAQVYFEWRYRVRTVSIIVLPVILAMLTTPPHCPTSPARSCRLCRTPRCSPCTCSPPPSATERQWSPSLPRSCTCSRHM